MSLTSTPGHGVRSVRQRLTDDLKNVERGIKNYHANGRDNPALLRGLEARMKELEAAIRRTPAPLPPSGWDHT